MKKLIIISLLLAGVCARAEDQTTLPVADGPFKPTEESLKTYQYPEWFRDAKFGIWSHWGPQAVPRQGDWYAQKMYMQKSGDYKWHLEHYGHPSKFGYKDIIPLWKAGTSTNAGCGTRPRISGLRPARTARHSTRSCWAGRRAARR